MTVTVTAAEFAGALFKLDSESGFVRLPVSRRWRYDQQHQGNSDSDCRSRDSEQIRVSRAQTGPGAGTVQARRAGGQAAPGHTRQLTRSWHNLKAACNSSELDMYLNLRVVTVDD